MSNGDGPYAAGPGGKCVCPDCGYETEHKNNKACSDMKCPECGANLIRKEATSNISNHKYITNHIQNAEFGLEIALNKANVKYTEKDAIFEKVPITKRGVMNGGYKPEEEVEAFAKVINDFDFAFPTTLQHPSNHLGIVMSTEECIGLFKNASYNPETTQVYADVHINLKYTEIVELIKKGVLPDVSIGYFADVEELDTIQMFNDDISGKTKEYNCIERNLFPNHLAVLGRNEGACSVKDGCGFGCVGNSSISPDSYKIPPALVNGCECKPVWIEPESQSLNDTGVKNMPDNDTENDTNTEEIDNAAESAEVKIPDMMWKLGTVKTCQSCGTMVSSAVTVCPTCMTMEFWNYDLTVPATNVPGVADEFYYSPKQAEPTEKDTGLVDNMTEEVKDPELDVNALGEDELKENAYVNTLKERLAVLETKFNEIELAELNELRENVKEKIPDLPEIDEMDRSALENALKVYEAIPEKKVVKVDTHLEGNANENQGSEKTAFQRVKERNTLKNE